MKRVEFETRDEWLAARRLGIGGSDIAAVLGMSPFASPYSLWAEKTGRQDGPDETEPMLWGRLLESAIAAEFARRTGLEVRDRGVMFVRADDPTARVTVDGLAAESDGGEPLGVVEVKVTGVVPWSEPPDHYQLQCQWAMFVCGLDHAWLVALHGGRHMRIHELSADVGLQAELYAAAKEFWRFVETDRPPPVDASPATTATLRDMYPGGFDEQVELESGVVTELRAIRTQIKALADRESELANRIKETMGDHETGTVDGVPAVRWSSFVTARIDTTALKAEQPEVAAAYTRHVPSRRFVVLKDTDDG